MLLCAVVTCLIKHMTYYSVFGVSMFSSKQNRQSRVYDVIGRWFKIAISLDLNILRNIWDNAGTQVSKIHKTVLAIFGYFNKKTYIVPLRPDLDFNINIYLFFIIHLFLIP